jgi:TetR/AcrR family transcriptional regulator, mexJK operon transcriptional repressor
VTEITRRRGRPSRAEAELRIEHLLDVAAAVFIEEGYNAATMEGIAQAAGFWKQAIYQRYGDKRTLFAAVVERLAKLQEIDFPDDDDLPLAEGLRLRVHHILTAFLQPEGQAIYKLFMRDSHRFPELVGTISKAADNNFRLPLQQYLKNKRRQGLIRKINIARVSVYASDLVYGTMMRFFLTENLKVTPRDIRKASQEIADILLNGLIAIES